MSRSTHPTNRRSTAVRLLVLAMLLFGLIGSISGAPARADDAPVSDQPPAAEFRSGSPTDVPTALPTAEPSDAGSALDGGQGRGNGVAGWTNPAPAAGPDTESGPETPAGAPVPDEQPDSAPTTAETAQAIPTATATTAPARPTATATTVPGAGPAAQAITDTGVLVTMRTTPDGAPIPGVCMTLSEAQLGIWQDSGCTDEHGQLLLNPIFRFTNPVLFDLDLIIPPGYQGEDFHFVTLVPGRISEATYEAWPAAPGDDTLKAVDRQDGKPLGGACWSYYERTTSSMGDLLIGPVCDEDGDGTVVVEDVPFGPYCIKVTPPPGYRVMGDAIGCLDAGANRTITKAFRNTAPESGGSLQVTFKTPWGSPIAGVCAQAVLDDDATFDLIAIASACSDETGVMMITALIPGDYVLVPSAIPTGFSSFDRPEFTISGITRVTLDVVLAAVRHGDSTLAAVIAFGPDPLPGACWSLTTNDGGKPGATTIIGPLCDTDGNGTEVMEDVPFGSLCYTVTPPDGWYRPEGDYFFCAPTMGRANWRVGFIPVPPPPTSTPSGPSPTATATRTPTPTPTAAPNEPNGAVIVRNCADYTPAVPADPEFYYGCTPVPAGVRFAVIQDGEQVATVVTGADGTTNLTLPERVAYRLRYLDGNDAGWVPGNREEARSRYDSATTFFFYPDPALDPNWSVTARVVDTVGAPVGGACFELWVRKEFPISDYQVLVPEVCDTDGDGAVTFAGLEPDPLSPGSTTSDYQVRMTEFPPGYTPTSFVHHIAFVPQPTTLDHHVEVSYTVSQQVRFEIVSVDDVTGEPVPGFCYAVGSSPVIVCESDDKRDGVIYTDVLVSNTNYLIGPVPEYAALGYTAATAVKTVKTGASGVTRVEFLVHRFDRDLGDRADLIVRPVNQKGFSIAPGSSQFSDLSLGVCFKIDPVPADAPGAAPGTTCALYQSFGVGQLQGFQYLFPDLPVGTYTVTAVGGGTTCQQSVPLVVEVTSGDLGKVLLRDVAFTCSNVPPECAELITDYRDGPRRVVDFYWGTLTDPATGETVMTSLQLSESVSFMLAQSLVLLDNPASSALSWETMGGWIGDQYGLDNWSRDPDWGADALAALIADFERAGVPYELLPAVEHGSQMLAGALYNENIFNPDQTKWPGCSVLFRGTLDGIEVRFHEVNATLGVPAEPSPTPTSTPEAFCETTVTRSLTAAYGELLGPDGERIFSGLELSDRIPPGLVAAIEDGPAPGDVEKLIGLWLDSGATDEFWAEQPSEDRVPVAALTARYQELANGAEIGSPRDAGTEVYRFRTYRYVDQADLPAGCFTAASFGLLVPVEQVTVVEVSFTELNAALGGTGTVVPSPSATATPTRTPAAGPEPTPTGTPGVTTLPNTGAPGGNEPGGLPLPLLVILGGIAAFAWTNKRLSRRAGATRPGPATGDD